MNRHGNIQHGQTRRHKASLVWPMLAGVLLAGVATAPIVVRIFGGN